ncbi:hypothetical protein [Desulfospira joergensenii]|uniref:hypothetical protein n=1 Tax=Desulfospira joergensenii TaxID=53329 RepID=UPI0003B32C06|nr:hypothetical protein [Desulfospira joergensenii]
MSIETVSIDRIKLDPMAFEAQSLDLSGHFAACLSEQMGEASSQAGPGNSSEDTLTDHVNTLKEEGFIGFFKKIQEEKMEELREKILKEMGLTEEDLAKMPPEQRAAIEKIIAKEISKRMSAQSAMEEDKETNSIQKRLLLAEIDGGMDFQSMMG